MPAKIIAGTISLIAFAVAVLAGLAAGNPALEILWVALGALIVFYVAGLVIGAMAFKALTDEIADYKARHPIDQAGAEFDRPDDEPGPLDSIEPGAHPAAQRRPDAA